MKLNEDFFAITACNASGDRAEFTVRLNADHPIYAAHFPGNPVTPGVCIVQIVNELAEEWLGTPLTLQGAKRIKFLNVINPTTNPLVHFTLETTPSDDNTVTITASATAPTGEPFSQLNLTLKMSS